MDLKEYFPESISVIHPDDSHHELCPNHIEQMPERMRFVGRKLRGRDPPLLPTIVEATSSTDLHNVNRFPINCMICYKTIIPAMNGAMEDYFKPCACPLLYAHNSCALRTENFIGSRCGRCHEANLPKLSRRTSASSRMNFSPSRQLAGSDKRLIFDSYFTSAGICALCQNSKFRNPQIGEKFDAKFVRPCFCGYLAHHGCLVEQLKTETSCGECGVKFRFLKYGSIIDFFKRYYFQYFALIVFFAVLTVFFYMALSRSILFTNRISFNDILLFVISMLFFVVIISIVICLVRYTINTRIPRFQARYGRVTVLSYDPDASSKKDLKKMIKTSRILAGIDTSIHMEDVRMADDFDNSIDVRTDDLTLGQCMFGVYATHHSSSTPIKDIQDKFIFEASSAAESPKTDEQKEGVDEKTELVKDQQEQQA
ncbi:unnamed protein product [Caenorhabditis bovis]|uniref:RING-type domain-containing protein n=1 Tax=Caenorhabditis bovis TaxID=2654633 RepID=A0A8S1EC43_9PELO|nr:unnamed protein product [Caenorhabditis bovis]